MLSEASVATHATALVDLIDQRLLVSHFQPIVQWSDGSVHGHEVLIRTPPGCRWANPDALFGAARESGLSTRLEGIIIVDGGRYRGLGSGKDLVRTVTESRIEAARHANPLTLLPGNIPITQHIARLLSAGREFVACYGDLNHFKPFNDQYGYWRGDEMILLAARCITAQADPRRDFVGHVGGDDFVVLFQSDDWQRRCEATLSI